MHADYIWMNGELVPWDGARVHVSAHALHYGSSVFEGLRAYEIGGKAMVFCAAEHFDRLRFSCKVARLESPLSGEQWLAVTAKLLRANRQLSAYIRPLVFRGSESFALDGRKGPVQAVLMTVPWGSYLGEESLERGVDVQVSSWRRASAGATPTLAKIGGHYTSAQNIAAEAHDNGFGEGIALDAQGNVSEGSGENVFVVCNEQVLTPSLGCGILSGVTRRCVMTIASELGYEVKEAALPREVLYLADEVFLTGTAAEVCPVRSIDRMAVGDERRGPVTKAIQDVFFGIVRGTVPDKWKWLTPVPMD